VHGFLLGSLRERVVKSRAVGEGALSSDDVNHLFALVTVDLEGV
jgi:hypothetical protein